MKKLLLVVAAALLLLLAGLWIGVIPIGALHSRSDAPERRATHSPTPTAATATPIA